MPHPPYTTSLDWWGPNVCLLQVCAFAGPALPYLRELYSNSRNSTSGMQWAQRRAQQQLAVSVSSILLHVSGGGGGDPPVHLLTFPNFCVSQALRQL